LPGSVDFGLGRSSGFLLLGGRLGDLLGRRRVLLLGLALFSGASLLAGLAQTAGVLIGARALQGLGAALVAPSALSILAMTFAEGRQRNWALGIFGAVGGSSASIGVIASGLLTDGPGWRWIFFINVPIGVLLILVAARFLPADRAPSGSRRFDALGASTVTGGLLLLVYGLNRGVDHGWTSATTLALFAGAAILLVSFAWLESRSRSPLVPGAALRNRTMVAADLAAFLLFGAFFSFIFLVSLLMQQLLRYSPTRTGVAWLATSLTAFLAAGVTGARLVSSFGVRRLLVVGMSMLALGVAWLLRVPPGTHYLTDLLPAFLLAGIAIGLSAPTVQIGALLGVGGQAFGLASGPSCHRARRTGRPPGRRFPGLSVRLHRHRRAGGTRRAGGGHCLPGGTRRPRAVGRRGGDVARCQRGRERRLRVTARDSLLTTGATRPYPSQTPFGNTERKTKAGSAGREPP
jgi:predicted MFS family arabinose efflux permease